MAIIKPFKGTYYNQDKVKMDKVITQPYDKIDSKLYQTYIERSPYNAVRLILKEGGHSHASSENIDYGKQSQIFQEWMKKGVMVQDEDPTIYPYIQDFNIFGERKKREAFIALGLLHNYQEGKVYPHEETLSKPKQDRLAHLRATQTQFGLIFMLYEDPQNEVQRLIHSVISSQKIFIDTIDHDYRVRHRVWKMGEKKVIDHLVHIMKNKKLLIADGHHRYETALAYRDEMREKLPDFTGSAPYEYALMAFVNLYDEGLSIFPTHRLVRNISDNVMMNLTDLLRKDFRIERIKLPTHGLNEFIQGKMHKVNPNHHVIGLYYGGEEFVLLHYLQKSIPKEKTKSKHSEEWRSLDVSILHVLILQEILGIKEDAVRSETNISYCREIDEALGAVRKGHSQVAFLLNPTQATVVKDIAFGGERMPQKSTDFYPKLMTGLMLNVMEI